MIAANPVKSRGVCVKTEFEPPTFEKNSFIRAAIVAKTCALGPNPLLRVDPPQLKFESASESNSWPAKMDDEEDDLFVTQEFSSTTVSYFETDAATVTDNLDNVNDNVDDEDQSPTSLFT